MIKLLASDLDGTIIDNNNQVSNKDLNVINKLNNTTVNFAVCTGKTYSMIKNICSKLRPTYGIFGNGTQIVNLKTGEEIFSKIFKKNMKGIIFFSNLQFKNVKIQLNEKFNETEYIMTWIKDK